MNQYHQDFKSGVKTQVKLILPSPGAKQIFYSSPRAAPVVLGGLVAPAKEELSGESHD